MTEKRHTPLERYQDEQPFLEHNAAVTFNSGVSDQALGGVVIKSRASHASKVSAESCSDHEYMPAKHAITSNGISALTSPRKINPVNIALTQDNRPADGQFEFRVANSSIPT